MFDNFLTDEETGNYRDMVLMNAENTMDIANEKGRNFKENRNSKTKKKKRTLLTIRKRPQKLFRHIMKKTWKIYHSQGITKTGETVSNLFDESE